MPSTEIKRKVKIVTKQRIDPDQAPVGDYPFRKWSIEVYMLNDKGEEISATVLEKVTYDLHPSFGKRAKQVKKDSPYRVEENGWGEFEMVLTLTPLGKSGEAKVPHDLNFAKEQYDNIQEVSFKNPKQEFIRALDEAGAGVDHSAAKKGADKKRRNKEKTVDMEKLADGLQKLGEEDLLHVVQMIHDQKGNDSYTKNDPDAGEFSVDLYTLPDGLVKSLWEFTSAKTEL